MAKIPLHDPKTVKARAEEKLPEEVASVLLVVLRTYEKGFHNLGNRKSSIAKITTNMLAAVKVFLLDQSKFWKGRPTLESPKIRRSQALPPSKAKAIPAAAAALHATKIDMIDDERRVLGMITVFEV